MTVGPDYQENKGEEGDAATMVPALRLEEFFDAQLREALVAGPPPYTLERVVQAKSSMDRSGLKVILTRRYNISGWPGVQVDLEDFASRKGESALVKVTIQFGMNEFQQGDDDEV